MDIAATGFVVIGVVGLVVVIASLVIGEIFDGVFEALDIGGGGLLSAPVIGSFLAAFGFGASLLQNTTAIGVTGATLGGLGAGVVMGGLALGLTRMLINMPTDRTPSSGTLVGMTAVVVTRIPPEGLGEITVNHHGQNVKLNARSPYAADEPIPAGTAVVITAVMSSTSVVVEPATKSTDA